MSNDVGAGQPGRTLIEDVIGTRHPYINLTESAIGTRLNNFRRSIAVANPFAFPQIPSQDRVAFGIRKGNGFYTPAAYPNSIAWGKMFPAHYDPLSQDPKKERWQIESFAPGAHSHFAFTADKLPKGCVRQIQVFKRCEMINGKQNCQDESDNILKICPTRALDEMKEKGRFLRKVAAINNHQYVEAMEVSSYNQGRTLKDISDKTWIDGTREHLRPDTLWADERYSKITQAEINEAKKRMEERHKKRQETLSQKTETHHEHKGHTDEHHYDYKHIALKHDKPLYP